MSLGELGISISSFFQLIPLNFVGEEEVERIIDENELEIVNSMNDMWRQKLGCSEWNEEVHEVLLGIFCFSNASIKS